ncbi:hypothetical protein NEI02_01810 [Brachyspira pilosicoli]|uniref:Transmembrane protein n=1 Tax=Brachyspira pilosicoli TaxID=52584 RepID=A0AAJ6KDM5_BRAPL|nr:hypothetical protein [Brachyspira pilosicoli]WIH90707.1 hypothetical protein NEI02_01810 [Brachyspira pilosicoli]WIH92998.1 hypothetical protein NEI01_01810 [Brachyspira pilosicoli]WIH95287.1 hypothetical protein NEH99_01805 [Brachyspira pilosicoli]
MKANTIKNVFTMASLYFLKNLLNISCKLLPMLIIALSLLNLSKTIVFNWRDIVLLLILEAILIVGTIIFYSLFFKKDKDNNKTDNAENTSEGDSKINEVSTQTKNKLPILNIAVAFLTFLTFIFIILKLFNAVTWSWVWVLFPLWFSTALIIAILIIFIIYLIISLIAKKNNKNEKTNNIESDNNNTENNNDSELNN